MSNKKLIDTRYCALSIFLPLPTQAWLDWFCMFWYLRAFIMFFTQVLGVDSVKNRLQEQATQKRQKPLTAVSTWISGGHTHAGNTTREKHADDAWALSEQKENKREATPVTMLLNKYDTTKKTEKFEREAMHHSGHVIVVCKSWAWKRCIMCTSREFGWGTVVALWPFMRSTLLLKFNTWMKATGQKWFIFEDII